MFWGHSSAHAGPSRARAGAVLRPAWTAAAACGCVTCLGTDGSPRPGQAALMLLFVIANTHRLRGECANSPKPHARFCRWARFMGRKILSLRWVLGQFEIPKCEEPESYNPMSILSPPRLPDQWPPCRVCYQGQSVLFPVGGRSRGSAQRTGGEPRAEACVAGRKRVRRPCWPPAGRGGAAVQTGGMASSRGAARAWVSE